MEDKKASARGHYSNYTGTNRARTGEYAAQNGIARACPYFASTWSTIIPEPTVRRFFENKLPHVRFPLHPYTRGQLNEWVWLMYNRKSAKFKPTNMPNFAFLPTFFPANISPQEKVSCKKQQDLDSIRLARCR